MIAKTNVNSGGLIRIVCLLLAVSLLLFGCVVCEYSAQESDISKQEESVSENVSENVSADVSAGLPEEKPIIEYDLLPEGNEDAKGYVCNLTAQPLVLQREYEHLTKKVESTNEKGKPYAVCLVRIDDMPKESVPVGRIFLTPLTVEILHVIMASDAFDLGVSDKINVYDRVNWIVSDESTAVEYWEAHLPITDESSYYIAELSYSPENIDLLNGCEYEVNALTIPINKETVADKTQRGAWAELLKLPSDVSALSDLLISKYSDR